MYNISALDAYNIRQQNINLSDEDFITWCNTQTLYSEIQEVQIKDFMYYIIANGLYAKLFAAQYSQNPITAGTAASTIAYLNNPSFQIIRKNDPLTQQMISGLVALGVFTQEEIDNAMKNLYEVWREPIKGIALSDLPEIERSGKIENLRQQNNTNFNNINIKIDNLVFNTELPIPSDIKDL